MSDISLSCWKQVMSHDIKFMFDGLGFQKFLCLPSCFLLCVIGHANLGYFRAPCLANLTGQSSLLRLQLRERNVWRAVRRRTVEHKWGRYLLPRLDQKKNRTAASLIVSRWPLLIRRTPRLQESPAHHHLMPDGHLLTHEDRRTGRFSHRDTATRASKPLSNTATQKSSSPGIAEPLFFRLRFLPYSLKFSAFAWLQHQFKLFWYCKQNSSDIRTTYPWTSLLHNTDTASQLTNR